MTKLGKLTKKAIRRGGTGEWDYPDPLRERPTAVRKRAPKKSSHNVKGYGGGQKSKRDRRQREWKIESGKASKIPTTTNVDQAIANAGL